MGYTTEFSGSFHFNKEITTDLKYYINKFAQIRHVKRDVDKIKESFYWEINCWNGDLGCEGEYFIGGEGYHERELNRDSIISYNCPPADVPGLWCDWIINDDNELVWGGLEKFYNYIEWLEYLINNFFEPEGYILNGSMYFRGENFDDVGEIIVTNNKIEQKYFMNN